VGKVDRAPRKTERPRFFVKITKLARARKFTRTAKIEPDLLEKVLFQGLIPVMSIS
jgi:hypothetical protein